MTGRAEKYSILIFSHNFSIELRLNINYEYNVLTRQTRTIIKKIISHFVLPFVLADIHTSRSETLDKHRTRKLCLLDSYLYNPPNSENKKNL